MKNKDNIIKLLSILAKPLSFEIIAYCSTTPRSIKEISKHTQTAYTSCRDRIRELVSTNILEETKRIDHTTNRQNNYYLTTNFSIILDKKRINEYITS